MLPSGSPSQPRLLKANDVRGLGSKVVFNFEDLRQRGDQYVDAVREEIRRMLEQAEADAAKIRQEAREQGFAEGRQQGLRQADELIGKRAGELADQTSREKLATTLPAMQGVADALVVERDSWLAEWEATAVRLAAAIAGRIVRRRIEYEPEAVRDMIRSALQLAVGTAHIRIKLHPEDVALLGAHAAEVTRAMASCGEVEIVQDASIARGGCLVETRHGAIDARVETLLDRIAAELLEDHN